MTIVLATISAGFAGATISAPGVNPRAPISHVRDPPESARPLGRTAPASPPPSGIGNVSETLSLLNDSLSPGNERGPNGVAPQTLSLDPATHELYIGNWGAQTAPATIQVLDTLSDKVVRSVTMPIGNPYALMVDPENDRLFVADYYNSVVRVLNASSLAPIENITVGDGPVGLVFDPVHDRVYVTCFNSQNLTVINATSLALEPSIPSILVGYGGVVDPSTNRLYVVNFFGNYVYVINTSSELVEKIIPVGGEPDYPLFVPSLGSVFVPNGESNNISVINTTTNSLTTTYSFLPGVVWVCWDPVAARLAAVSVNASSVILFGLNGSDRVTLTTGSTPTSCQYDPSSDTTYVSNSGARNLTRINETTGSELTPVELGATPVALAVEPTTGDLGIIDQSVPSLRRFTLPALAELPGIGAGELPDALAFDGRGEAYLSDEGTGNLLRVNLTTGIVTGTLDVGPLPGAVEWVDPAELSVAIAGNDTVAMVNTTSWSVSSVSPVGSVPAALGLDPIATTTPAGASALLVANSGGDTLTILSASSGQVVGTVPVGDGPAGIGYSAASQQVWVANMFSKNITVLNASTLRPERSVPLVGVPSAIAVDPTTGDPVILYGGLNELTELYWSNFSVRQTYSVGLQPVALAYDVPDGLWLVANDESGTISVLPQPLGGPNPRFEVDFNSVPAGCASIMVNGSIAVGLDGSGSLALAAGTYPLTATACTNSTFSGWSSSPLVSVANPELASTTMTVAGPGLVSVTTRILAIRSVWVQVTPAGCGSIALAGENRTNGTQVVLREGTYPVTASGCSGYSFDGWSSSGGLLVWNESHSGAATLNVTSNGTLSVNWTITPTPPSFWATYAVYLYTGIAIAAVATLAVLVVRRARRPPPMEGDLVVETGAEGVIEDG